MDRELKDDTLKLVRFKILFVKRDYEHAFPDHEELVADEIDGNAFTARKMAEFIEELARGETPVPKKWVDKYPTDDKDGNCYVKDGRLIGLPEEDKKCLRVYYELLER